MPDPERDPPLTRFGRVLRWTQPRRLLRLSLREYLPLAMTIALWALILATIGHADTVRLLAATVALRAIQMLTRLATAPSIKARVAAPKPIRRQARRVARLVQLGALAVNIILVVALMVALDAIGQGQVALFVPLVALGMPARVLRYSDVRTDSPYFRLALAAGGLATALVGWAAGFGVVAMGLAFGMREWIAYAVIRLWPKAALIPKRALVDRLGLTEIGRNTALSGRRLLTYRVSKVALTIFGPAGNLAARTGRGLNWHNRIEPYLPHRLSGFVLFALAACAGAVLLALRSGEPLAMVGAAGLLQLAAASANIALMWPYLPDRNDPDLVIDEDDDE